MASSLPYRFPAPPGEDDPTERSARQSCGTCGASAVANCVALCCCPCAVVSCFTLALVKAPYMAGRRWARRAKTRRIRGALRKTKRVRDLDDELDQVEGLGGGGGTAPVSKDWGEPGRAPAAASGRRGNNNDGNLLGENRMRVSVTEKAWMEMYEVGHWGFGRLSFSVGRDAASAQVVVGDDGPESEEDGTVVAPGR